MKYLSVKIDEKISELLKFYAIKHKTDQSKIIRDLIIKLLKEDGYDIDSIGSI